MMLMQTYMLKLARSGEDGEKAFLVLESGSRFHTTQVGLPACLSRPNVNQQSKCCITVRHAVVVNCCADASALSKQNDYLCMAAVAQQRSNQPLLS